MTWTCSDDAHRWVEPGCYSCWRNVLVARAKRRPVRCYSHARLSSDLPNATSSWSSLMRRAKGSSHPPLMPHCSHPSRYPTLRRRHADDDDDPNPRQKREGEEVPGGRVAKDDEGEAEVLTTWLQPRCTGLRSGLALFHRIRLEAANYLHTNRDESV
jgi:hypothetical protein